MAIFQISCVLRERERETRELSLLLVMSRASQLVKPHLDLHTSTHTVLWQAFSLGTGCIDSVMAGKKSHFQLVCHFKPPPPTLFFNSINLSPHWLDPSYPSSPLTSLSLAPAPYPTHPFISGSFQRSDPVKPSLPSHILIITPSILHPFLLLFSILLFPTIFLLFYGMISLSNSVPNANIL